MADQVTVLQLVLDQIGIGNDISTQDDRIAIQKLVCLTQEAGLQLGYSFNWYVRGPYSPALTSDYYQIASNSAVVEGDAAKFVLTEAARGAVERVRAIIEPPNGIPLPRVLWLELVASIAFLIKRYRFTKEQADQKISASKPYLHAHFEHGYNALHGAGFLG